MTRVLFAPFEPDAGSLDSGGSRKTVNAMPTGSPKAPRYGPMSSLQDYSTDALTGRCLGTLSVRDSSGNTHLFAGDTTKLYKLPTDLSFDDITRASGGAYAVPTNEFWWSVFWNSSQVIMGNGADAAQEFTLGSSTKFAALAGSPPAARHAAVVGPHLMLGSTASDAWGVQWCAAADATTWTTGGGAAGDSQGFDEGGWVRGIANGRLFSYLWQEELIRRITYTRDNNHFVFDIVARDLGLAAPRSLVSFGSQNFFLASDGFYRHDGETFFPIGRGRVDQWFYDRVDDTKSIETYGVVDPSDTKIYWAYYTANTDYANNIISYDYYRDRWAEIELDTGVTVLSVLLPQGVSLEDLDSSPYSGDIDDLRLTTSGELIGSLDDRSLQGGLPALGAFNSSKKMAFFGGANLAACIDTSESEVIPGRRCNIVNTRPLADVSTAKIAVGWRESMSASTVFGESVAQEDNGDCPQEIDGRLMKARMEIPAGAIWTEAMGVDFDAIDAGAI